MRTQLALDRLGSRLTVAAIGLVVVAVSSSAALTVSPRLGATARYQGFAASATPAERGSGWMGFIDPQFELSHADAKSNLRGLLRGRFDFRPDAPRLAPESNHAHAVLTRAFTRTASIDLEARMDRVSDPLDAEFAGVTSRHTKDSRFASMAFENVRAEGAASVRAFRYQPADIQRGTAEDWRLALAALRTETQIVRTTWRDQGLRLSDGQGFRIDQVALGVKRMATAGVVAEFEAGGFFWSRRGGSELHRKPSFSVGLRSGADASRPPIQVDLRLSRDVSMLWQVEVARLGSGRRIMVAWEREPDYACTVHPSPIVTRRVRLGLRDTLGQTTIFELEGSRERAEPVFFGAMRFHADRAGLTVTRTLSPGLAVRTAGQFVSLVADDAAAHPRKQFVRFEVSLLGSRP